MFTNFFGLTNEPEPSQENEDTQDEQEESEEIEESHAVDPLQGLWGLAAAVTNTVKQQADGIVKSVAQTDWKAELMAFTKEAAEETKNISSKAVEVVEHIPDVVEHLHIPEQAGRAVASLNLNPEVTKTINTVGGTLKTFGTTLFQGTKEFIEQVKDAVEGEIAQATQDAKAKQKAAKAAAAGGVAGSSSSSKLAALNTAGKYSRFEAEVAAMQRDSSTYLDEPSDGDDFSKWRSSFSLAAAQPQIDAILADNSFMAELHARIVPVVVEAEDFWLRYFYRLNKLTAREEARQGLAQRALANHEEEDLGWDDDDLDTPKAAAATTTTTITTTTSTVADPTAAVTDSSRSQDEATTPGPGTGVVDVSEDTGNKGVESISKSIDEELPDSNPPPAPEPEAATTATTAQTVPESEPGSSAVQTPVPPSEGDDHDHDTTSQTSGSKSGWCVVGSDGVASIRSSKDEHAAVSAAPAHDEAAEVQAASVSAAAQQSVASPSVGEKQAASDAESPYKSSVPAAPASSVAATAASAAPDDVDDDDEDLDLDALGAGLDLDGDEDDDEGSGAKKAGKGDEDDNWGDWD